MTLKNPMSEGRIYMVGVIIITILIITPFIGPVDAESDLLKVPNEYATIQAALNASSDGDIIYVSPGIYNENIFINKNIKLIGESKNTTIITGSKIGDVIYAENCSMEIQNICIKESGTNTIDAGIKLKNANGCKIKDSEIQMNNYGVYTIFSTNITVENSIIFKNYYGIFVYLSSDVTISHNTLYTNYRQGVCGQASNYNSITNNTFSYNIKEGIYLRASGNNYIGGNYVFSSNNGIYLLLSDENIIVNNTIASNKIGVYIDGGNENTLYHNNMFENSIFNAKDNSHNFWDSGYPGGGNYWSNFDEPSEGAQDSYQGPNQDVLGRDGISDSSYFVVGGNRDNYPYMGLYGINDPPRAKTQGPYAEDEGVTILFNASESYDPDLDELQYRWDFDGNGVWDTEYTLYPTSMYTFYDDYSGIATVEVYDGKEMNTDSISVIISNVAPMVSVDYLEQLHGDYVLPHQECKFYGSFVDQGTEDTHTIEWDFGDNATTNDTLTPTHSYAQSGLYEVTFKVTDDDGGIGTASVYIFVFSPVEAVKQIIEDIEKMELPNGLNNSLVSKLDNAVNSMERGNENENDVIKKLEAFINQVEAQRGKNLTYEEADGLIAAAQLIIDNII
jgi:parallel beta-helix repeat protein